MKTNIILHYVEVVYLKNGQPNGLKFAHYPEEEAERMYQRTINKFKQENRSALINLREENHMLLKSEKINF